MQPLAAAALRLLDCLDELGACSSNPVLAVLGPTGQLCADRQYPSSPLVFGGGRWRAYYHFHADQPRAGTEHGHFHVFVRAPETPDGAVKWAHLAGLGMDHLGQPMRWFSVNGWVTDDAWMSRAWLCEQMQALSQEPSGELVADWLAAMIATYADAIDELLGERDDAIAQAASERAQGEVLRDRALYTLAESPLDLSCDLPSRLSKGRGAELLII